MLMLTFLAREAVSWAMKGRFDADFLPVAAFPAVFYLFLSFSGGEPAIRVGASRLRSCNKGTAEAKVAAGCHASYDGEGVILDIKNNS